MTFVARVKTEPNSHTTIRRIEKIELIETWMAPDDCALSQLFSPVVQTLMQPVRRLPTVFFLLNSPEGIG